MGAVSQQPFDRLELFARTAQKPWFWISISKQRLYWVVQGSVLASYPISSGQAGVGERYGSFQTPRGWHHIVARVGAGLPLDTVLIARRPQPSVTLAPGYDAILARILWLSGLEVGFNRGGAVDTRRRFVYIHGMPDSTVLGVPASKGCIRMRSSHLAELFDHTPSGTMLWIGEASPE